MGDASGEILGILLLILVNGLFAMSELAVVSSRKTRLRELAESGRRGARAALALADAPERFLSTVQIGITVAGIFAGALGGRALAAPLAARLVELGAAPRYAQSVALGLVVAAITYLSLVLGELAPKRVALADPEGIACRVAGPMSWLARAAAPAVWLLGLSTRAIARVLGVHEAGAPPVSEEEVKMLLEQGADAGVFHETEQEIVGRLFRLGDRTAGSLMTPRSDIVWVNLREPDEIKWRRMAGSRHTHFPVCDGALDDVIGVASVKSLWDRFARGETPTLEGTLRVPLVVPETASAFEVLDLFRSRAEHVAVVIDEHGGVAGLVTLNDFLEALVGELSEAGEPPEEAVVVRADGSWLVSGLLPVGDLKELLGVRELPDEARARYLTLAGFVIHQLGRIPKPAEGFEWGGYRFEVLDLDGRRVDRVLIARAEAVDQGD